MTKECDSHVIWFSFVSNAISPMTFQLILIGLKKRLSSSGQFTVHMRFETYRTTPNKIFSKLMGKVMNIIWHSRTLKHCERGESSDNSYSRTNQGVCLILLRTDCGNRNFSTIFTEHRPAIFPVYRHSRTNY